MSAICSVICNLYSFEHIIESGRAKYKWFKNFWLFHIASRMKIPLNVYLPESILMNSKADQKDTLWIGYNKLPYWPEEIIDSDGKTLRRSHDNSNGKLAINMVRAWICANKLVVGQIKTDEKLNEIAENPNLLIALEIQGRYCYD
ncbi:MAG: ISAs1 family transposase [Desulfobacteraceae bacterium]|nr:ISAs1 family transposase [Desulfobacteraceae bacterium]